MSERGVYSPLAKNIERCRSIKQHFDRLEASESDFADYLRQEFGQFIASDHIQRLKAFIDAKNAMLANIVHDEMARSVNLYENPFTEDNRRHVEKMLFSPTPT
jgi:hypothetical protein